jgi:protein-S-isoprenylcysteine O-methyltransferase Ste14
VGIAPLTHSIIVALWLALLVVWAIAATRAQRNVIQIHWWKQVGIRLPILALILLIWRTPALRQEVERLQFQTRSHNVLAWIGVAICALGVALAIAARIELGRNWGMPASRKENPDLITAGPYRFIRHPIYAGILVAIVGTALTVSVLWFLLFIISGVYFVTAARREERFMITKFPDQYPAYMKRTRMLLPFVL